MVQADAYGTWSTDPAGCSSTAGRPDAHGEAQFVVVLCSLVQRPKAMYDVPGNELQ